MTRRNARKSRKHHLGHVHELAIVERRRHGLGVCEDAGTINGVQRERYQRGELYRVDELRRLIRSNAVKLDRLLVGKRSQHKKCPAHGSSTGQRDRCARAGRGEETAKKKVRRNVCRRRPGYALGYSKIGAGVPTLVSVAFSIVGAPGFPVPSEHVLTMKRP